MITLTLEKRRMGLRNKACEFNVMINDNTSSLQNNGKENKKKLGYRFKANVFDKQSPFI